MKDRYLLGFPILLVLVFALAPTPGYAASTDQGINDVSVPSAAKKTTHEWDQASENQMIYVPGQTDPTQFLRQRLGDPHVRAPAPLVDDEPIDTPILPQDELVGDERNFNTYSFDSGSYVSKPATLMAVGDNSYIYVENDLIPSLDTADLEDMASTFDTHIYPITTGYFGTVDGTFGDIDGDPHVTVFMAYLDGGAAGFFDSIHEYDSSVGGAEYSNEREMVFIDGTDSDLDYIKGVLSHEFQHLIHFNNDRSEHIWLDEGMAEMSRYLNGYMGTANRTSFVDWFEGTPDDDLLLWDYDSVEHNVRIDYGGAYLFMMHLTQRYGLDIIDDIVSSTGVSANSIEAVLDGIGAGVTFTELAFDWITSLYLDDDNTDYYIDNVNVEINLASTYSGLPQQIDSEAHLYGADVYEFTDVMSDSLVTFENEGSKPQMVRTVYYDSATTVQVETQIVDPSDSTAFCVGSSGAIGDVLLVFVTAFSDDLISPGGNSWGAGVGNEHDYSLFVQPSETLSVNAESMTFDYADATWVLTVDGIVIEFENGTEATDVDDVSLQMVDDNDDVVQWDALIYSEGSWGGTANLQDLDMGQYTVDLQASGADGWGSAPLNETLSVNHYLSIDGDLEAEPNSDDGSVAFSLTVDFSQSGTSGFQYLHSNAEVYVEVLQPGTAVTVVSVDLTYDAISGDYEGEGLAADLPAGEYDAVGHALIGSDEVESATITFTSTGAPTTDNTDTDDDDDDDDPIPLSVLPIIVMLGFIGLITTRRFRSV